MEWYQQALIAPQVLEGVIRLGLIPAQDHGQWLVELKDPTTGVLIAQASKHAFRMPDFERELDLAAGKLAGLVGTHVQPF
jgi:hypothetical protein